MEVGFEFYQYDFKAQWPSRMPGFSKNIYIKEVLEFKSAGNW